MKYVIYAVTSKDHWYVGSSYGKQPDAHRRFRMHCCGTGKARKLHDAIIAYGQDSFSVIVLEAGDGDPIEREAAWYDLGALLESRECLNGIRPVKWPGDYPPERRAQISDRARAQWQDLTHRQRVVEALTGRPVSAETRRKQSEAQRARYAKPEERAKTSAAQLKRYRG